MVEDEYPQLEDKEIYKIIKNLIDNESPEWNGIAVEASSRQGVSRSLVK